MEQTKLASDLYRLTLDRVRQGASAQLDANRALQQVNTLEQERLEAEQNVRCDETQSGEYYAGTHYVRIRDRR